MNSDPLAATHVAFDFDGTLVDSPHLVVNLYNDVAQRYGYVQLTSGNIAHLRGLGVRERARVLGVPTHRLFAVMLDVLRAYRHVTAQIALHPGVPELLEHLRARGTRLFVVSTNREDNIREVLRRHDLEHCMDRICTSHHLFGKAQLLRRLLHRERIAPGVLWYVGDEQRDIEACHEVGVRVVAVDWGIDTVDRLRAAKPDLLVSTPAALARFLGASTPGNEVA